MSSDDPRPSQRPTAGPRDAAPIDATLIQLADLLDVIKAGTVPTPEGPLGPALKGLLQQLADRDEAIRGIATGRPSRRQALARIDRIIGIERLRAMYYGEAGRDLEEDGAPYVHRIIADLADRPGMTLKRAKVLTVARAVAMLAPAEPRSVRAPAPPVGSVDAGPARTPSGGPDCPAARPEATAGDASEDKVPPPAIDYEALAAEMRKQRKGTQAALVEYMADKPKAKGEEIAEHVHGDSEASDSRMWNNAKRTSDSLAELGSPLSFRFASGWMFREISPA
jgi:hypothetical protein